MRLRIIYDRQQDKTQMLELKHLSAIRFRGADAGSFLHGQLSADVLALSNGDSTFACYCEPKGRVLALMLVQKNAEDYYVIMSSKLVTAVIDRLKIYRMRSKVEIENLNEIKVCGLWADNKPEPTLTSPLSIRLPGNNQWLLMTDHETEADKQPSLQERWRNSELQMGISWLNPETSGQFLPQMLGFEQLGAVNYRKGCYPGQEIVARTHYLGKIKRHPRIINCRLTNHPKPMDKIKILNNDLSHDAVVADCGSDPDGKLCLLVVTRMAPEMPAQRLEFQDEIKDVI
jgi:folate-binding protein YgfZ